MKVLFKIQRNIPLLPTFHYTPLVKGELLLVKRAERLSNKCF
jgi:hypothetical protein